MNALSYIRSLFGNTTEQQSGVDSLQSALARKQQELNVTATYGEPYLDPTIEETAVFPYTVYDSNGEVYDRGRKEFFIPEDGLDISSGLKFFLADQLDKDPDDVDIADVAKVQGTSAEATVTGVGGETEVLIPHSLTSGDLEYADEDTEAEEA